MRRIGSDEPLLYAESHDRVDDITIILLQCLDCLVSRDAGLSHDELDILVLESSCVGLLFVLLFLGWLGLFDGLAFAVVLGVVVTGVIVAGVVVLVASDVLGSKLLLLRVQVFDLGFTENAR